MTTCPAPTIDPGGSGESCDGIWRRHGPAGGGVQHTLDRPLAATAQGPGRGEASAGDPGTGGADLGGGAHGAPLAEALRDDSEYVRHDAATASAKFGPDAGEAVPALRAALKDRDHNVRRAAETALKKVAPDTTGKEGRR